MPPKKRRVTVTLPPIQTNKTSNDNETILINEIRSPTSPRKSILKSPQLRNADSKFKGFNIQPIGFDDDLNGNKQRKKSVFFQQPNTQTENTDPKVHYILDNDNNQNIGQMQDNENKQQQQINQQYLEQQEKEEEEQIQNDANAYNSAQYLSQQSFQETDNSLSGLQQFQHQEHENNEDYKLQTKQTINAQQNEQLMNSDDALFGSDEAGGIADYDTLSYDQAQYAKDKSALLEQGQISFKDQVDPVIYEKAFKTPQPQISLTHIVLQARQDSARKQQMSNAVNQLTNNTSRQKEDGIYNQRKSFTQIAVELNQEHIQGQSMKMRTIIMKHENEQQTMLLPIQQVGVGLQSQLQLQSQPQPQSQSQQFKSAYQNQSKLKNTKQWNEEQKQIAEQEEQIRNAELARIQKRMGQQRYTITQNDIKEMEKMEKMGKLGLQNKDQLDVEDELNVENMQDISEYKQRTLEIIIDKTVKSKIMNELRLTEKDLNQHDNQNNAKDNAKDSVSEKEKDVNEESYITFQNAKQIKHVTCIRIDEIHDTDHKENQRNLKKMQNVEADLNKIMTSSYLYLRMLIWLNYNQAISIIIIGTIVKTEWYSYPAQIIVTLSTLSTEFLGVISTSSNNKIIRQSIFLSIGGAVLILLLYYIRMVFNIRQIKHEYTVFCNSKFGQLTLVRKKLEIILKQLYKPYTLKMKIIYILLVCLYLPIVRNGLFVFTCYSSDSVSCWKGIQGVQFAVVAISGLVAVAFGIGFPLLTYFMVKQFSPSYSYFDQGNVLNPMFHTKTCPKTCRGQCKVVNLHHQQDANNAINKKDPNNQHYMKVQIKYDIKRPLDEYKDLEPNRTYFQYQIQCINDISPYAYLYQGYNLLHQNATLLFLIDKVVVSLTLMASNSQYFTLSAQHRLLVFTIIFLLYQSVSFLYSHYFSDAKFMLFGDSKDDYYQSTIMLVSSIVLIFYKNFEVYGFKYIILYYVGISLYYGGTVFALYAFKRSLTPASVKPEIAAPTVITQNLKNQNNSQQKTQPQTQQREQSQKQVQKEKLQFSDNEFNWDLQFECLRRIWQPFWVNLFKNDAYFGQGNQKVKVKTHTNDTQILNLGSSYDRIKQIQDALKNRETLQVHAKYGLSFKDGYTIKLFTYIQQELEGNDVYWTGQVSKLNFNIASLQRRYFGKLQVTPFPAKVCIQYDGVEEWQSIPVSCWKDLCEINMQENIQERALLRKKLRALCGKTVQYRLERRIRRKTGIHSEVYEIYKYTEGLLKVNDQTTLNADDYEFTITLHLKNYKMIIEGMDQTNQRNYKIGVQPVILRHADLGIRDDFKKSAKLDQLFYQAQNQQLWSTNLQQVFFQQNETRVLNMQSRRAQEHYMSWTICPGLLCNFGLSLKQVRQYVRTYQPTYINFLNDHQQKLAYLYNLVRFVAKSPVNAFWYTFFDDVWYMNFSRLINIEENFQLLNPEYTTFIGLHLLPQSDLTAVVQFYHIEHLFTPDIINRLYSKLGKIWDQRGRYDIYSEQPYFRLDPESQTFPTSYLLPYKENRFQLDLQMKAILPLEFENKDQMMSTIKKVTVLQELKEMLGPFGEQALEQNVKKYGDLSEDYFTAPSDEVLIRLQIPEIYYLTNDKAQECVDGWVQKLDQYGRVYYSNFNTQETQFMFPGAAARKKSKFQQINEKEMGALPMEYEAHYSYQHNRDFYANTIERKTTWTDPRSQSQYQQDNQSNNENDETALLDQLGINGDNSEGVREQNYDGYNQKDVDYTKYSKKNA